MKLSLKTKYIIKQIFLQTLVAILTYIVMFYFSYAFVINRG